MMAVAEMRVESDRLGSVMCSRPMPNTKTSPGWTSRQCHLKFLSSYASCASHSSEWPLLFFESSSFRLCLHHGSPLWLSTSSSSPGVTQQNTPLSFSNLVSVSGT